MKSAVVISILLFALVQGHRGCAQDSTARQDAQVRFKLGSFFTSRLHYYGRTDSLRSSGFFPVAECWVANKFYLTAAPVFTLQSGSGLEYAGTVATAGFRFMKEKKYNANLYVVKPIYKENSQLLQAALQWQGAASYTWLNPVVNLTIGGDVKFSNQTDYGAMGGLDHLFRKDFPGGLVLVLNPSAYVNAGTQEFTRTSYQKSGFLFFPGTERQVTEEVKRFNILSYEFSMPVVLAKDHLQLILLPGYVLPRNLVRVENRPDLSERGKDMFYVTAGLKYSF